MTEQIDTIVEAVEKFATDAALYGAEINEPYYFRLARCLRALPAELTAANTRADQARNDCNDAIAAVERLVYWESDTNTYRCGYPADADVSDVLDGMKHLKTSTPAADDARDLRLVRFIRGYCQAWSGSNEEALAAFKAQDPQP